ncbi:hypothetical protein LTR66_006203 [Elasticomyces elasticus]|nr:hypothetical protein LTR66_006203 [Elasticomyces elasticus]
MCIALISTAHPKYPLILLSNRDEFLDRPTAPAAFWDAPNSHVLGGRDLQRPIQGTWLGITKQGRIAVLTNFREEDQGNISAEKSRGGIPNALLTLPPDSDETTEQFAKRLIEEGVADVGGFSLAFGRVRKPEKGRWEGLAIVSNRTPNVEDMTHVATAPNQTVGLSNSLFGDSTWPKVVHGERLLEEVIHSSVLRDDAQEKLVEHFFDILSLDTLPKQQVGEEWTTFVGQLRRSIFVPAVGGKEVETTPADKLAAAEEDEEVLVQERRVERDTAEAESGAGKYGTQKQTVILVSTAGHVTYIERTLYGDGGRPVGNSERDKKYEFDIEGWDDI